MRRADGFTLIELLVALAVFSLAVLALLNVTGESTRTAAALESGALAGVVAENRAVEAMVSVNPPRVGVSTGVENAGGRAWRWTVRVLPTPDPGIVRVDVAVTAAEGGRTLADLSVFRAVL